MPLLKSQMAISPAIASYYTLSFFSKTRQHSSVKQLSAGRPCWSTISSSTKFNSNLRLGTCIKIIFIIGKTKHSHTITTRLQKHLVKIVKKPILKNKGNGKELAKPGRLSRARRFLTACLLITWPHDPTHIKGNQLIQFIYLLKRKK